MLSRGAYVWFSGQARVRHGLHFETTKHRDNSVYHTFFTIQRFFTIPLLYVK